MKKEAFEFITELIKMGKPGMKITRAQVTRHMLRMYNPGVKDKAQASCRGAGDSTFAFYIRKGILKRIGRGKYEIIASLSIPITYKEICNELKYERK